jgi:hypothetical protein
MNVSVESKFKFRIENTAAAQQKSTTICEKLRDVSMDKYLNLGIKKLLEVNCYIHLEYLIA